MVRCRQLEVGPAPPRRRRRRDRAAPRRGPRTRSTVGPVLRRDGPEVALGQAPAPGAPAVMRRTLPPASDPRPGGRPRPCWPAAPTWPKFPPVSDVASGTDRTTTRESRELHADRGAPRARGDRRGGHRPSAGQRARRGGLVRPGRRPARRGPGARQPRGRAAGHGARLLRRGRHQGDQRQGRRGAGRRESRLLRRLRRRLRLRGAR